jgi:uncharacterized protein DUF4412
MRSCPHRRGRALAAGLLLAAATTTVGCDKLGLGKKDGDGGSTGGGLGSIFDSTFEGDVSFNVSSKPSSAGAPKEAPKTLVLGLKTPRIRIDAGPELAPGNPMLAGGVAFIVDPPAKKGYALINAQKKAVVIDFDKSKGGFKPPSLGGGGSPSAPGHVEEPPKIENTHKKDTIAGYTCEIWKITSKTSHAEACLAEKIKWIDFTDLAVQSPSFAAIAAVSDFNHLPLRIVSFDEKNVEEGRMEVTKIDKKKLPDNHFSVPPDFQIVELSALIGSMMGAPPGGVPGGPPGGFPGAPGAHRPALPPGFVPPKR